MELVCDTVWVARKVSASMMNVFGRLLRGKVGRYLAAMLALAIVLPVSLVGTGGAAQAHGARPSRTDAKPFNPHVDRSADRVAGDVLVKLKEPGSLSSGVVQNMMACFG